MSAFTVFSSDCILLNNLIDGLGSGAGPNLMSSVDGQNPLTPKARPGRWVGVGGEAGGEWTD